MEPAAAMRLKAPPPVRATLPAGKPETSGASKPKPTVEPAASAVDDPNGAISSTAAAARSPSHLAGRPNVRIRSMFILLRDRARAPDQLRGFGRARPTTSFVGARRGSTGRCGGVRPTCGNGSDIRGIFSKRVRRTAGPRGLCEEPLLHRLELGLNVHTCIFAPGTDTAERKSAGGSRRPGR